MQQKPVERILNLEFENIFSSLLQDEGPYTSLKTEVSFIHALTERLRGVHTRNVKKELL